MELLEKSLKELLEESMMELLEKNFVGIPDGISDGTPVRI